MDTHRDAANQRGVFQVRSLLVEINLAESEGVFTFKLAWFHSFLLAKDIFCHRSINPF